MLQRSQCHKYTYSAPIPPAQSSNTRTIRELHITRRRRKYRSWYVYRCTSRQFSAMQCNAMRRLTKERGVLINWVHGRRAHIIYCPTLVCACRGTRSKGHPPTFIPPPSISIQQNRPDTRVRNAQATRTDRPVQQRLLFRVISDHYPQNTPSRPAQGPHHRLSNPRTFPQNTVLPIKASI